MPRTAPFDEHFEAYEQWFSRNPEVYRSELKAVAQFIPASGEGLEIGVGSGKFAAPLGIRFGVEPSEAMRRLAGSRGITVCGGVAEDLPFPAGRFDFALRGLGFNAVGLLGGGWLRFGLGHGDRISSEIKWCATHMRDARRP